MAIHLANIGPVPFSPPEQFSPDAMGNMGPVANNGSNQLTSCTYDKAGNLTFDGTQVTTPMTPGIAWCRFQTPVTTLLPSILTMGWAGRSPPLGPQPPLALWIKP